MADFHPVRFIDEPIEVIFNVPPVTEKSPPCPDGFTWAGNTFSIAEKLSEWFDYSRRGRAARNMQPAHAAVASRRGSLGAGRFYFRICTDTDQIFDLYYDRAILSADDRKGHWFIYREMAANDMDTDGR